MPVVIINPNSTVSMTEAMTAIARETVQSLPFEGWTSHDGPPSIQGEADGTAATPPFLELVQKASDQKASGIIIGCFDDTALVKASQVANCPVIGIGQASYHYAALRNWRFSVVTTLAVSIPVIEDNIKLIGLSGLLGKVRASNVPVLALESDPAEAERLVIEEAQRAEQEDEIDAVILGCAGMATLTGAARAALNADVIDPVASAASCMTWLT